MLWLASNSHGYAQASRVYWVQSSGTSANDAVRYANLDGSGVNTLISDAANFDNPQSMWADVPNNTLYVGDGGNAASVGLRRFNLTTGTQITGGFSGVGGSGIAINAIQVVGNRVYWVQSSGTAANDAVMYANLDGSGVNTLISGAANFDNPLSMWVDAPNNTLYVGDGGNAASVGMRRFNLTTGTQITGGFSGVGGSGIAINTVLTDAASQTTSTTVSSITRNGASPTNAPSVSFTVTFAASVSGVSPGTFAVTTSGVSGANVASVSGSGTTYTVTVNGISGDGTVRLDVVSSSGITPSVSGLPYTSGPSYTIDQTAPNTTITANPTNPSNSSNATFQFTGTDPIVNGVNSGVAGYQAQLDGGGFSAATSPRTYTGLSDGNHTFQVRAVDGAGNIDPTPASYTWFIDTTPPPAPVVLTPANGSLTNNATPTYTGTAEATSTVTVIVDGSSVGTTTANASGNWALTQPVALAQGSHTVKARATDAAGNTSVDSNTNTFTVDTTPPPAPVVVTPANGSQTNTNTPTYTGTAEASATVTVIIDGSSIGTTTANASGNWVLTQPTALAQGSHTVRATATDAAGNTSPSSNTNNFTVDTTRPSVAISSSAGASGGSTSTSPIPFTVTFSESVTGFIASDVAVTGGSLSGFSGSGTTYSFSVTPSGAGTVTVNVAANVAQDAAGNGNTAATQFSITYSLPTATVTAVTGLTPSPTATTTVSYAVTFSAAVSGLTTTNFNLTTTGLSGASISSVSGSGTTYTVVVNTGSGDGTLRLNVDNSTGVTPTVTNVPYTSGTTYTITKSFAAAPTLRIQAAGSASNNGDVTAFVDVVQVLQSGTSTVVPNGLQNGSFETNNVPASSFKKTTDGVTADFWSFTGLSGVSRNGSAFGSTAANGDAVALIQSAGDNNASISQNLAVPTGSYQVTFQTSQRNYTSKDQRLNVFVNNVFVGNIQPNNGNPPTYDTFTSATFSVTAPALTATVSTTSASPTSTAPIPFSVSFSQSVGTSFTASDVTVTGGTLTGGSFSGSGSGPYTFTVTPSASGTVTVSLAAGVASDANNTGNTASNSVSVQYNQPVTAAPVVVTPANGSLTNTSTPTYSGTAPANSTVTVYADNSAIGTTTANASGNWSLTQPTALAQGSHTVYATAQLSGQAVSANSNTNTFIIDTTPPPAPVVLTPANGSLTNNATPTYTGTAEANSTVTVLVDGSSIGNTTANASGNWSLTQPIALSQGAHTVRARATDAAGNTSVDSNTNTFTVDTTPPPAPVVVTPANGSQTNTNTPTYTGTAEASATVTVIIDGSSIGTTTANASGNWVLTQPTALAQGSHTVRATATDAAGNTSPSSNTNNFTVDTTRPSVAISSSAGASGGSTPTSPIPFTVTFSESVTGFIAGDVAVTGGSLSGFAGSGSTYTFNVTPAGNGSTVTVNVAANVAQDAAGNGNTAATQFSITYNQLATAAPVVVTPANGSLTNTSTPTYSGTAPVNSTVTVYVNNVSIGTTTTDASGNWTTTQPTALADGLYTVYATAQSSGQAVSANSNTNTFTVDTTRPSVAISSSAGASGGSTSTSPIPFTVTFSESVTGFIAGDVAVTGGSLSGFAGSGSTYTFNVTPSGAGTVTVNVAANVAQDAAGNGNTAATQFSITYNQPVTDLTISTGTSASPVSIAAGTYNNVTVTGTGFAQLGGAVVVNGAFTVQGGLNTACQSLSGSGSFTLQAGATLYICNAAGITSSGATGAVQLTGTRSFSPDADYVYNGSGAQVTGNGLPAQVRNLTSTNTATLTLSQPVAIRQVLTLNNGNLATSSQALTLLSDASGTALIANLGAGTVSGAVTVQRYIDGALNPGLGYRHLAAPVFNATVASFGSGGTTPVVNPAYNTAPNPGQTVPFPTVFYYDQSRLASSPATTLSAFDKGWTSPSSLSEAAQLAFQGFTVQLPGASTLSFTGTVGNSNGTIPLSRNSGATAADAGWNLIGNPYPAPLDFSSIPAGQRTNMDAAFYTFESTSQYGGQYRSYVNGVGNPLIGTAQAFFVRVSAGQTAGSLTLNNANRGTTYNQQAPVRRDQRPQLQLTLAGTTLSDALTVYAEAGATLNQDRDFDAQKLWNPSGLSLAAVTPTGDYLAIDGRAAFVGGQVTPLTVQVPQTGRYTFTAATVANLPAGTDLTLVDLTTGTRTLLTAGATYAVQLPAGTTSGRLQLEVGNRVTSTAPAALAAQVQVFPNPAHDHLTLYVPAVAGTTRVTATLHNALGQVVRELTQPMSATMGLRTTVELQGLPVGMYTLQVKVGGATVTRKVVVE